MSKNYCQLSVFLLVSIFCLTQAKPQEVVLYEGDECVTNSYDGICSVEKQCPHLEATMTGKGLLARDVGHCGYTVYEEIICCPSNKPERPIYNKYFAPLIIQQSITLIITSTPNTFIQTEKIGDQLLFSQFNTTLLN
ncbi:uncharacterized protein LOC126758924 [Bactrocera neohumeralis]|uniref:uncharacterized protein LOC120774559 n=1 Tax=Bactrocera tryoni TaxID=59916 RepID=UPI001A996710|nr:uncharacterized protein LOC120774559 [Bactrocera tryoni]XP_050329332.1 uncharacterized protein LOC126758924 [Bactrocera neohumeralis]